MFCSIECAKIAIILLIALSFTKIKRNPGVCFASCLYLFRCLAPILAGLSLFILLIKSFDRADYYRLRQWTIQSVVMDCIVCRSRLYGLL